MFSASALFFCQAKALQIRTCFSGSDFCCYCGKKRLTGCILSGFEKLSVRAFRIFPFQPGKAILLLKVCFILLYLLRISPYKSYIRFEKTVQCLKKAKADKMPCQVIRTAQITEVFSTNKNPDPFEVGIYQF